MNESDLKIESALGDSVRPILNDEAIVDQIWIDLQGTVDRSIIRQQLMQAIPRFRNARVKTYVPIFLHRVTLERLRADLAEALPIDAVELTEERLVSTPDSMERATAPSRSGRTIALGLLIGSLVSFLRR